MKARWSGDWPIPRTIQLPGVRIAVRALPPDRRDHCTAMWIYDHAKDTAVIYIDDAAPIELQRYALLHELQHAVIELVDVLLEKYPRHVRLEREGPCDLLPDTSASGIEPSSPSES